MTPEFAALLEFVALSAVVVCVKIAASRVYKAVHTQKLSQPIDDSSEPSGDKTTACEMSSH
jgi:hypothetical protein